jgi:acetyl esterase/lipase
MIKFHSFYFLFSLTLISLLTTGCFSGRITKSTDITYDSEHSLKLDVYAQRKKSEPKPVIVFIHGGSWKSGKKSTYKFLGKGLARHGLVAVIIDYRLSQLTAYGGMAMDAANALKWVKQNISTYNGDTTKLFVAGHSAGGHLAALISTDNRYFDSLKIKNPIRGVVLIDGFGLDIYTYLKESANPYENTFTPAFTAIPETWKSASPIFYLKKETPPFLMFLGGKTNRSIFNDNHRFFDSLVKFQPNAKMIIVKRRRHVGMIFQYINRFNKGYKEITDFVEKSR